MPVGLETHAALCLLCGLLMMNYAAGICAENVHKRPPVLRGNKGSKSSLFLSDGDREPLQPRTFQAGHFAISSVFIYFEIGSRSL